MQDRQANIVHINITDFAAAVEVAKDPTLADRPFAIAYDGPSRRVVITTSRKAWEEGIRAGMPVTTAQRLLPSLKILPPDAKAISKADSAIASLVKAYTPDLQCDRGGHVYLDMKGTGRLFGPVVDSALRLRREIRQQLGLDGAVAVASNKLVAKIGTRTVRPGGITQIREGEEASFLADQDVSLLSGVGPAIGRLLTAAGITQIGQLAALDDYQVIAFLGKKGLALRDAARGIDISSLHRQSVQERSIHRKVDFAEPILEIESLKAAVIATAEDAALEMRLEHMGCQLIEIRLQWSDGRTSEARRRSKGRWVFDQEIADEAFQAALQALDRRVRLLSFVLRLTSLTPLIGQTDLFIPETTQKEEALQKAVDAVRCKFGPAILTHAAAIGHAR